MIRKFNKLKEQLKIERLAYVIPTWLYVLFSELPERVQDAIIYRLPPHYGDQGSVRYNLEDYTWKGIRQ